MKRFPLLLLIASFILIVSIGIISIENSRSAIRTEQDISRTNRIFFQLEELISIYKDLIISAREYIITGDTTDLIVLNDVEGTITAKTNAIQEIMIDSAASAHLDNLNLLMRMRLENFAEEAIDLRRELGFEAAQKYFRDNKNQALILKDIPFQIQKIKAREEKLLAERIALSNKETEKAIQIIILGIVVSILSILIAFYFIRSANIDLKILSTRLQLQNRKLSNFSHVISHNLRSPVGNLNSLLTFYKSSDKEDDRILIFQKFEKVIEHLTNTLNELLEALRIQEDTNEGLSIIRFDETVKNTQEILIGKIMETRALITTDFSKGNTIEYVKTYMDSIVLNLLSNAIKYRSPERTPEIHFETDKVDGQIILRVKDNGLGIDLDKHGNKIFGLNNTFHMHAEAKGVGLFITKNQIESMGGIIRVESEVDKGTIFTIVFLVLD